jgi:pentatricopeptide repeat domain-containing protein 2
LDLWKKLKEVGHIPMRRAVTFAAGLALNQNAPHIAFEMISDVQQHNYVTIRNLKVSAIVTFMYLTSLISATLKCI